MAKRWIPTTALVVAGSVLLFLILLRFFPLDGVDWFWHFFPDGRAYLEGRSLLYDADTTGFYHPPWVMWYLVPFIALPYDLGLALMRTVSILMIGYAAWYFAKTPRLRIWAIMLAVFNLHAFDLLQRGQITAVNALGAVLAWHAYSKRKPLLMGIAYVAFTVSLPNAVPFALVILWYTWKNWGWKTFAQSLIVPAIVGLGSFAAFGWWPARWVENVTQRPPSETSGANWFTTIWRMQHQLDLPALVPWLIVAVTMIVTVLVWRKIITDPQRSEDEKVLQGAMLWTVAAFLVTPWALSYRYVLLYAVLVPWLLRWRVDLVIVTQVLTFLPVLRVFIGVQNAWIDLLYVLALFLLTIVYLTRRPHDLRQHPRGEPRQRRADPHQPAQGA